VLYQLGALDGFARVAGDRVRYLKPHGALYNTAVTDRVQAGAIVDALLAWDRPLPVLTLPGGALAEAAAEAGLPVVPEAFADRGYRPDGTLQPRGEPGSVLTDPDQIADRALRLLSDGTLSATDGSVLALRPASLCVHGDTPGAALIVRAVRDRLDSAGIEVVPFA
jgi:UPF0271 protein